MFMKKLFTFSLLFIFLVSGLVFADTNGVWHKAQDVRSGTFGSDEAAGSFSFMSNVGIGTTTPTQKLEIISGNIAMTPAYSIMWETGTTAQIYGFNSSGKGLALTAGGGIGSIIIKADSGNVGIGTISPTQKLDIIGKIRMRSQTLATDGADIVTTKGYVDNANLAIKEWVCSQTGLELKPDGACGPKPVHLGPTDLSAYACSGWAGCTTPTFNICDAIPGIKSGDKFTITSTAEGSSWILSSAWIQSYEFTFATAHTHSYTASGSKRNTNQRIYDGNCIVYGTSSYSGDSTNYKSVAIKLTNLDFEP